ncbi:MAG: 50S ribosomal protein L19e [Methanobacteriota archaeon]|nr:MAG: 50S ribosomal protein L19e [Euryarchaeota archaeon]
MTMRTIRRLAASILKVGRNKIRILDEKKVSGAATREDVKQLITEKAITKAVAKGKKKKESRRQGPGRRKGTPNARKNEKEKWMERVRSLRKYLRQLVAEGKVPKEMSRSLYMKIKGNQFRGKKAFYNYLKDAKIIKE